MLTAADADACGVPEPVGLRSATGVEFPVHAPSRRSAAAAVPALMPQMQQLTRVTRRYGSLTFRPHLRFLAKCGPGSKGAAAPTESGAAYMLTASWALRIPTPREAFCFPMKVRMRFRRTGPLFGSKK